MIGIESKPMSADDVRALVRAIQAANGPLLDAFHQLFYASPTWSMATWQGVSILKNPCDLMTLQEIIFGQKPSLIVETGTAFGGSALFLAHLLDLNGRGEVITIDVDPPPNRQDHPRVRYVTGSSIAPAIVDFVHARARLASMCWSGPVMVLLDSDHHEPHVSAELAAYASLVTPGSYLVVEDTNVNGRPIMPEWGPGPGEAVDAFLLTHPEFERDVLCERYLSTMHPGGWLRRVR